MGQKVHPHGFRLGFNKTWRSRWFADRDYAKLLRRIGLGDGWADARRRVDEANPYVMRYVNYFERFAV